MARKTDKKGCSCEYSPVIILPGINHSPSYLYDRFGRQECDSKGKPIGNTLLIPDIDGVKGYLPGLAKSIALSILTQKELDLRNKAYSTAAQFVSHQECDCNGNHVKNIQVKRWNHSLAEMTDEELRWVYIMVPMKELVEKIGKDHVYFFTFNLVGDPMNSADDLNDYIQMVKKQTGHKKVTLLPVSLGGTILTAYLDSYGHKDIDRIVNAVACLNGTDIVGDLFERKFNVSDMFFRHEFIPKVIREESGNGTAGYLINTLMHMLPRKGVDALLSGAVSGILETMILKCPQMWAMLPSYRYDTLAERYLSDSKYAVLKEKTDRFQKARLNLNSNILKAVTDGVRVDSVAASNLDFGEKEYSFFGIVDSASSFNTDGIINLSSTTLGATGAPNHETLGFGYKQASHSEKHPDYSYISPDRRIDVSTALLPDHTWIFLDQHHEVGRNDVVLNLCKSIILNEVTDVHSDPENHPQFNHTCNTYAIRRWIYPDCLRIKSEVEAGKTELSSENIEQLSSLVDECKAVLTATVADEERTFSVQKKAEEFLISIGRRNPPKDVSKSETVIEEITCMVSKLLVDFLGSGSLCDKLLNK